MIDFIQSPLQFVRPMTDTEWHDLKLREAQREARKRQQGLRNDAACEQADPPRVPEKHLSRSTDTRTMTFRESTTTAN